MANRMRAANGRLDWAPGTGKSARQKSSDGGWESIYMRSFNELHTKVPCFSSVRTVHELPKLSGGSY